MKKKFGWIWMAWVLAVCGGAEGAGRMEMGGDGSLRVEAWGERFEQLAPKGRLTVTGRSAERIEFEYEENGFRAKGAYALNGDGSIGLKLKADAELKGRVAESYMRATPVARKTMFSRMVRHEVLGADRMVQRTRFANGVEVTVNFAQEEREGIAGESYLVEMR